MRKLTDVLVGICVRELVTAHGGKEEENNLSASVILAHRTTSNTKSLDRLVHHAKQQLNEDRFRVKRQTPPRVT